MIRKLFHLLVSAAAIFAMAAATPIAAQSRTIVDMAGRSVTVGPISRVWSAYPPVTYLVYAIDPSLLIGWTGRLSDDSKKYIPSPYRDMPVVGGWFGQSTPNFESLAAAKPNVALVWDQSLVAMPPMADKLRELRIPVVAVHLFNLSDYPGALRFLGDVLGRQKRAQELSASIEKTLTDMKAFSARIPEKQKLSVYYALGPDGLKNDCDHMPFLDEAIQLAGGREVHHCLETDRSGGQKIDLERLILYNPDVIFAQEPLFYSRIYSDSSYSQLKAVRNHRVYLVPSTPFNWLVYPPSFMRAIGIRWMAWKLYPGQYKGNIETETRQFFKLFLRVDISDSEVKAILSPEGR